MATARTDLAVLAGSLLPSTRRRAVLLMLLMVAGGVSELLSIGAVVPFIAVLAGAPVPHQLSPLLAVLPASGPAFARTFCGLLGAAHRPNTGLLAALTPELFTA